MNCGSTDHSDWIIGLNEKMWEWMENYYYYQLPLSKKIGFLKDGADRCIDNNVLQLNAPRAFGICESAAIRAGAKYFTLHGVFTVLMVILRMFLV